MYAKVTPVFRIQSIRYSRITLNYSEHMLQSMGKSWKMRCFIYSFFILITRRLAGLRAHNTGGMIKKSSHLSNGIPCADGTPSLRWVGPQSWPTCYKILIMWCALLPVCSFVLDVVEWISEFWVLSSAKTERRYMNDNCVFSCGG